MRAVHPAPVLLRAAAYAGGLFLLAHVVLLWSEGADGADLFEEYGRLEWAQVGLLAAGLALALLLAVRRPVTRRVTILMAGVAVATLVREHNNWFKDHVGTDVWQVVVGVIAATAIVIAARSRGTLRAALADLCGRAAFGWIAAGVVVFLFGQVLDERRIWDLLLAGGGPYAAQRMAEECAETAAYWLIAAGLLEWYLTAPRGDAAP